MGLRVILPYVPPISAKVIVALNRSGYAFERVNVSEDDEAYWRLLSALWSAGESFCIVEHDIVVRPDSLAELEACPNPWSMFAYGYLDSLYPGLGCCRFSADLIARHPDAMVEAGKFTNATHEPRHWCVQDAALSSLLMGRGEQRCVHEPPVTHLGDQWPSHLCHGAKPA